MIVPEKGMLLIPLMLNVREVDIVGICCDYASADSADDWWKEYGEYSTIDPEEWEESDEDAKLELIRDYLEYNTSVVCCESDCIIWQAF